MAKLKLRSGAIKLEKDITGKNCLKELIKMAPDGFNAEDVIVRVGGKRIDNLDINLNRYLSASFNEDVDVVVKPKGIVAVVIASIAASVAASYIISKQISAATQTTQEQTQDSPNNSFFGQTNTIRLDQLEPNIYGSQVSYPDLIVREGGAYEYINNQKIIKETFLIGQGEYRIDSDPRFELTPFSTIPGSSFNIYGPSDTIPVVQGQFNSDVIDGQTLLGPNNSDVTTGISAATTEADNRFNISPNQLVVTVQDTPDWTNVFVKWTQEGAIHMDVTYERYVQDLVCELEQVSVNAVLTNVLSNVGGRYTLTFEAATFPVDECTPVLTPDRIIAAIEYIGTSVSVELPIPGDQIQYSFSFLNGLRGDVTIFAVLNNGVNPIDTYQYTYSADTINQLFETEKVPPPNPNLTTIVKLIRVNNDKEDNTDRCQVSQVATNTFRNNVNYGDVTILQTERKATEQALRFTDSKINLDVTRKTISYDSSTGQIINTLNASRSFADAMLHEYSVIQGLDPFDLPLDDMYEISDRIGALGNFDFTFGDKEQTIRSRIDIIANVARCLLTFSGDGYQIYRNESQVPAAQFDARNISKGSGEEYSYRGASRTSNNGIQLKWTDPSDNKPSYIYYVIQNGQSVKCVDQGDGSFIPAVPSIPLEVDLTGCRTENQADDRADLECRSLIFIQKTLRIKTLEDGENVSRGQVVKHADYYEDDVYSGEIKTISGNNFTTHSSIKIPIGSYVVTYTDVLGDLYGPVSCEVTGDNSFTAVMPEAYVSDGINEQLGSRVIISTLTLHDYNLYFVTDKQSNADGTVDLELSQYDERVFPS